jgi:neopullulanase
MRRNGPEPEPSFSLHIDRLRNGRDRLGRDGNVRRFNAGERLMRFLPSLLIQGSLCCAVLALHAQAPHIDKIDPPSWWTEWPEPMLLVRGSNFAGARFEVDGKDVALKQTQISLNGHWAFLWLSTNNAPPQRLSIVAVNDTGRARVAYQLAAPSDPSRGHSGFSSADLMYLIMTDRFAQADPGADPSDDDRARPRGWHGGNLKGIEEHIDYLKQLGVTALWTTPVLSNGAMPDSYHGYAATDLYAVDPHFGTLTDYRNLSRQLHAQGIKLVIDLVPNHVGVDHPWVADPPAPGWFHGATGHHLAAQHDFYNLIDPHAPPSAWLPITDGWFSEQMPDLNQRNPLVASYLIQVALWWIETADLDGIRLDTFPYVDRAYWHQFHAAIHSVFPRLTTVGEVFDRDPEVTSFFAGGAARSGIDTGVDTVFDFPVYFTLRNVLAHGQPMTQLASILGQDSLYPHPERLVTFIGNHDTTRFLTEGGGSIPMLKLALGLALTLRGMPQIYSGDEIAMPGGQDPDDRHDFPGGFAGDRRDAFTEQGRTTDQAEVFNWTKALAAYRQAHKELQTGIEQDLAADADTFSFVRAADGSGCDAHRSERLLIVVNKASQPRDIELPLAGTALYGCTSFHPSQAAGGAVAKLDGGRLHLTEPAQSMTMYEVR